MSKSLKIIIVSFLLIFINLCNISDEKNEQEDIKEDNSTYDVDLNGIPKFVGSNYIQLSKIYRISRFRSGVGHSYTDDSESCRSMKHYFQPKVSISWSTVKICSPVTGTVHAKKEGWAGTQIKIKSDQYPAFFFIIFHVNLSGSFNIGTQVNAGQILGTHIGSQTMSDIAVGVNTPNGWKLISYFSVVTDALFKIYHDRGVVNRNKFIISQAAREADPLNCDGEDFENEGNLPNWVILN